MEVRSRRGCEGGAGAKLCGKRFVGGAALLMDSGPMGDPRIASLDKRVIRREPLAVSALAQASCLEEPRRGAARYLNSHTRRTTNMIIKMPINSWRTFLLDRLLDSRRRLCPTS